MDAKPTNADAFEFATDVARLCADPIRRATLRRCLTTLEDQGSLECGADMARFSIDLTQRVTVDLITELYVYLTGVPQLAMMLPMFSAGVKAQLVELDRLAAK